MKGIRRTPGTSTEDRENYWEKTIEKARAYPSGVTAFCRVHHIRKHNYYQWFKRLKLKHPEWDKPLSTKKSWPRTANTFVPVIVKDEPEKKPVSEKAGETVDQAIEIRMVKGHTILLPPGLDKETLKALIEGLSI